MAFLRKLTDEQVAEIIERRSTGESYKKISLDFDVSASRIYELTHPEVQAAKAEKLKAKNAAAKAAKKAAVAEDDDDDSMEDLDLSEVDDSAESEDLGLELEDEELDPATVA
jgi:hypothetical protein